MVQTIAKGNIVKLQGYKPRRASRTTASEDERRRAGGN
jgi:hypothetical protein